MITAKDLRVGNFVKAIPVRGEPTGICEVIEISSWGIVGFGSGSDINYSYDYVEPIPLSDKVLLACGFEKKGTTLSYVISFHKFNVILKKVEYNKGYHFELELIGKLKRIESLHALQNLFFCITGAELTIDINKLEG